jgi:hypothetical protein
MPAGFERASSVFLDSPVKPGNDKIGDGDVVIIMRPLINRLHDSHHEEKISVAGVSSGFLKASFVDLGKPGSWGRRWVLHVPATQPVHFR